MSRLRLKIFGSEDLDMGYISWIPAPLTIVNEIGLPNINVHVGSKSAPGSETELVFLESPGDTPRDKITISFGDEREKTIYVAGKFQVGKRHNGASIEGKDVMIETRMDNANGDVLATLDLMVRVRRNANDMSAKARKDFLDALLQLNVNGSGIFTTDFVAMHIAGATDMEHRDSHFLPWHRFYTLDLERMLQNVNPVVNLPYWRFDQPAPNVFNENFMGKMQQIPRDYSKPGGGRDIGGGSTPPAVFAADNPLFNWRINTVNGIPRTARFNPATEAANGWTDGTPEGNFQLLNQSDTLALGGGISNPDDAEFGPNRTKFSAMEGTPHGAAHVSFNGYINFVPVAPKDPLFFLLHCNVDRLWATWQLAFKRDDMTQVKSYPYQNPGDSNYWKIINAKQWPWSGGQSKPDNLNPPGTRKENFTTSKMVDNFVNNVPKIENAIDPYGYHNSIHVLGLCYDDVPFNFTYSQQLPT